MTEDIKAAVEHVKTYPERKKLYEARFDTLEKMLKEGLRHPEPAAKTIAMIGTIKDDMDEMNRQNARINRVLFGDQDNMGMDAMVKDMHEKLVQANGLVSFLKIFLLLSASTSALYYFFKKID